MGISSWISGSLESRRISIIPALAYCLIAAIACCVSIRSSVAGEHFPGGTPVHQPLLEQFGVAQDDLPPNLFLVRSLRPLSVPDGIRVLGSNGSVYLVSGEQKAIRALARSQCKVLPLARYASAAEPPIRGWNRIDTPDPRIEEMVARVAWQKILTRIVRLADFGTRYTFASNQIPVVRSVRDTLRSFGLPAVYRPFMLDGVKRWNVEAVQRGTRFPNSCVIICGHFDSYSDHPAKLAPGADDNGTGVATVFSAAEILSQYEFDFSIRYVCFSGEELGLYGSDAYAREARDKDLDIIGVLNFDMVGYWTPGVKRDLEVEGNHASRWLCDLVANAADLYTSGRYERHITESAWWSDHYSFWLAGYPALCLEEAYDWWDPDFNPYYHSSQDLPEHLDSLFTENNNKIAVASVAMLATANSVERVPFDIRPASCSNPFTPREQGIVRALLLGTEKFDVDKIRFSSLGLASGARPLDTRVTDMGSARRENGHPCADRSPDGFDDLLLTFSAADIAAALGPAVKGDTVRLSIGGRLVDGSVFEGSDVVRIVGDADWPALADTPHAGNNHAAGGTDLPAHFDLYQNVPNPFNPVTTIRYDVPDVDGMVSLRIYDVGGRLVRVLFEGPASPGTRSVRWNGLNNAGEPVASGIYICRLTGPGFETTRKMVLVR